MNRSPFLLGPQFPQIQPQMPVRPLPPLMMPQFQQPDNGQMMGGGMGLLGMMKQLSGLLGPSSVPGKGLTSGLSFGSGGTFPTFNPANGTTLF